MAKHTNGPWYYSTGNVWTYSLKEDGPDSNIICVIKQSGEVKDANGNLISAAPELLKACEDLLVALQGPIDKIIPEIGNLKNIIIKIKGEG